jgi:hypothetical protein
VEFPDLIAVYRMYRGRGLELRDGERGSAGEERARARLPEGAARVGPEPHLRQADPYALIDPVDPKWQGELPHTVVVAPGGRVVYRSDGAFDPLALRKAIVGYYGRTTTRWRASRNVAVTRRACPGRGRGRGRGLSISPGWRRTSRPCAWRASRYPALAWPRLVLSARRGGYAAAWPAGCLLSRSGTRSLERPATSSPVSPLSLCATWRYTAAFLRDERRLRAPRAVPVRGLAAGRVLVGSAGLGDMTVPVVVYMLAIGAMMWRAAARWGRIRGARGDASGRSCSGSATR